MSILTLLDTEDQNFTESFFEVINSLPLGNFSRFFTSADFFQILFFSKNSFMNMIRVSNSLDPGHVRPDLGPNCLQKLSAGDEELNSIIVNSRVM